MDAYKILTTFFDDGVYNEIDPFLKDGDDSCGLVAGFGNVDGTIVYAFSQNVDEHGGAMSTSQAKKILKVYDLALSTGSPVIGFYDSLGGKINDKEILSSYGKILNAISNLSGVVPQISVILGTCLGTSALSATSADFVIMTKDAKLSINTTGDCSDSNFNAKAGIANIETETDEEAIETAKKLLSYFPINNLEASPVYSGTLPMSDAPCVTKSIADEDSVICINGKFTPDVGTSFGRIDGIPVGFINVHSDIIDSNSSTKISKMVNFCDAFSIPVITFVNSESFECLCGATKVSSAYANATTAKITVINGKAIGAAYIALCGAGANCDFVFATKDSIISPVNKLASAFILDPDNMNVSPDLMEAKAEEFVKNNLSAIHAANNGYVDDVLEITAIRDKIISSLDALSSKRITTLPKKHITL